jgi:hypothetical protein
VGVAAVVGVEVMVDLGLASGLGVDPSAPTTAKVPPELGASWVWLFGLAWGLPVESGVGVPDAIFGVELDPGSANASSNVRVIAAATASVARVQNVPPLAISAG